MLSETSDTSLIFASSVARTHGLTARVYIVYRSEAE